MKNVKIVQNIEKIFIFLFIFIYQRIFTYYNIHNVI